MATSCENNHTKAYGEDLRWRMVYQAKVCNKTYREVGECLNVNASTVCRMVSFGDVTGGVTKLKYPENPGTRKLTEIDKLIILELVLETPGI